MSRGRQKMYQKGTDFMSKRTKKYTKEVPTLCPEEHQKRTKEVPSLCLKGPKKCT